VKRRAHPVVRPRLHTRPKNVTHRSIPEFSRPCTQGKRNRGHYACVPGARCRP
jgi:hypothetical protein